MSEDGTRPFTINDQIGKVVTFSVINLILGQKSEAYMEFFTRSGYVGTVVVGIRAEVYGAESIC